MSTRICFKALQVSIKKKQNKNAALVDAFNEMQKSPPKKQRTPLEKKKTTKKTKQRFACTVLGTSKTMFNSESFQDVDNTDIPKIYFLYKQLISKYSWGLFLVAFTTRDFFPLN